MIGGFAIADEATLIDFTLLSADISVATTDSDGNEINDQNRRTVMDYATAAGASFTDNQKALMKTSLALANWEVKLNKSAQNPASLANSLVKEAPVRTEKPNASGSSDPVTVPFAGQNVMGVRVVFPEIKAFGCCHEVFGTQILMAKMLEENLGIEKVDRADIKVNVVGVNHFTWLTKANYGKINLMDTYAKFVNF